MFLVTGYLPISSNQDNSKINLSFSWLRVLINTPNQEIIRFFTILLPRGIDHNTPNQESKFS